MRIIHAVARKDFRVFFRYPADAIMRVVEPVMWLTPVYFMGQGFSEGGRAVGFAGFTGTSDYFLYVVVGAFMASYISAVFWGMGFSLKEDMTLGVLEPNWVSPAPRMTLMAGKSSMMFIITTLNSIGILIALGVLFGVRIPFGSMILPAFIVLVPMLIGLAGFGFALSGLVLLMKDANTLVDVSNYVVGQLSGREFPVTVLPRPLLAAALALPTTYAFDAVRGLLLGTTTLMPMRAELSILVAFMAVATAGGYVAFKTLEQHCRKLGLLGTH
jgi:ABC-2 type transport system permease protein